MSRLVEIFSARDLLKIEHSWLITPFVGKINGVNEPCSTCLYQHWSIGCVSTSWMTIFSRSNSASQILSCQAFMNPPRWHSMACVAFNLCQTDILLVNSFCFVVTECSASWNSDLDKSKPCDLRGYTPLWPSIYFRKKWGTKWGIGKIQNSCDRSRSVRADR